MYESYVDGNSSNGVQVRDIGLRSKPLREENVTEIESQVIISLPVTKLRNLANSLPSNDFTNLFK